MTKFLLSCLLFLSMMLNAQITLGAGSTNVGIAPISTYYGYSYVQQIFTKEEINANAAGNITGLKFYLDPSMSIANSSEWAVYLGQTTKTSFTSVSDWVPLAQLTQVFSGTVTNANGVIEITFATPFPYNNVDNLVVAAEENSAGYDNNNFNEVMYVYPGAANSSITYRNDDENPDPASPPNNGVLKDYKSVTTFEGLIPNPIPACPSVTYPANNSTFVPLSPTITWNGSPGAVSYKVSIGTTSGGTDVANQVSVNTNSFTPATPFPSNTNLYIKVVAVGTGGESSGCSEIMFTTAPPAPANDECATAIALTVNPDLNCGTVTSGYTIGATDSGTAPDPCYGTPDDDVWFSFVATSTNHRISLLNVQSVGSEPDDTDTYFQVFSGGCGALSSVYCSDPSSGTLTGLTPGETYLVRVYSYYGTGSNQSFDICVGTLPPPPANDECSTAIALTVNPDLNCGTVTAGHTFEATDSGTAPDPCYGEADDDVWFSFVATETKHKISLSNVQSIGTEPDTYVYFQVFNGGCGALSPVYCSYGDLSGTVSDLTPGETYLVRVYSYSGAGSNQSFDICVGTFPPPPANDDCAGALIANTFPYTYVQNDAAGATNNAGIIDVCDDWMNDGTWFTFVGDGNTFNVTVTMPAGSDFDPQIGVYSGTCSALSCENTVDVAGSGGTETLSIPTLAGNTYYVNVGHYSSSDEEEGAFTINITNGTLGTSDVKAEKKSIKVYPNPFTDVVNIADATNVKSVSVSDVSGRLLKVIDNPGSSLNLGELKQGMYFLILTMKDGSKQTVKAIKK
ncbi:T9SS type A sorting domain-containing protein [Chryseobacterium taichungense]|uniref:T9SS type A sorting domain-containing protein n=1 Tax=Chryseobacterium taichungense TaxID=295069 RepID=UPI0028AC22FA|nr:T9SS type A sorting domain-containing protein [Chryseobacterium taichungense]